MKRFLLIILPFLLIGCSPNTLYEDTYSVNRNGWVIDSVGHFRFTIDDTTRYYNLDILVRNTGDYEYQNLWLFIEYVKPDMTYSNDTAQLFLADDYGNWIGSGIGSIYSANYAYRDSIRFGQTGEYLLNIRQGMRDDSLKGITDIGVTLTLAN